MPLLLQVNSCRKLAQVLGAYVDCIVLFQPKYIPALQLLTKFDWRRLFFNTIKLDLILTGAYFSLVKLLDLNRVAWYTGFSLDHDLFRFSIAVHRHPLRDHPLFCVDRLVEVSDGYSLEPAGMLLLFLLTRRNKFDIGKVYTLVSHFSLVLHLRFVKNFI